MPGYTCVSDGLMAIFHESDSLWKAARRVLVYVHRLVASFSRDGPAEGAFTCEEFQWRHALSAHSGPGVYL